MASQELNGVRILVVEDEPLIALDLCEILGDAGALVVGPASTVAGARALCRTGNVVAAILDVRLGRELVFPIAALLAERNVPFVFHTGERNGRELCVDWPNYEVLRKPAEPVTLVATLARLVC